MSGSHQPNPSSPGAGAGGYPATRLESTEEIQRALRARGVPEASVVPPAPVEPPPPDTPVFRPARRPPMAVLCIHDDGSEEGELLRLRGDRLVIGRSEGDVIIPHDTMMSGRHAELVRRFEDGRHRWLLTDLQSTNGTYVRVHNAIVKHGQELLIGSRRYRFQAALQDVAAAEAEDKPKGTQGWQGLSAADLSPSLVEMVGPNEAGRRYAIPQNGDWVGRDARLAGVLITDDPLVSPRHLRMYQDRKGRWHVENANAVNGVWLRVQREVALEGTCHFQLGEQRFSVRVL